MFTTVHEHKFCATVKTHYQTNEDIVKPQCVHEYNQNMSLAPFMLSSGYGILKHTRNKVSPVSEYYFDVL